MKRTTRRRVERILLIVSVLASLITIASFMTGQSTFAGMKNYVEIAIEVAPPIVRWPIKAISWVIWFVLVMIYRIVVLFALPILPALPVVLVAEAWVRRRDGDLDIPMYAGVAAYCTAWVALVIALNTIPTFSQWLRMD